jgi:murein DD-endopeptidase MepM/ murein hydrolase activator NlpD
MHPRRAGLAALLVTVIALSALGPAGAASGPEEKKKQVDATVRDLRSEVAESSRRLAAAERLFQQASAQLPAAQQALAVARGRLAAARANDVELARKLAGARSAEEAARVALQRVLDSIAKHREAGGAMGQVAVALEAESPDEFAARLAYLRTVMNSERGILTELGQASIELAEKRARLESVRRAVTEQRAAAAAALVRTRHLEQQATTAAGTVASLVGQRRQARNSAAAERAADLRRYREMRAESDRLARIIRQRAAEARERARRAHRPSRLRVDGGILSYPVYGPVTSGFGMRYHPVLGYKKLHTGTDFGVPSGTTVRAARGGTVIQSYFNGAYGNRVVVDHGYVNGVYLVTTYNHLSRRSSYVGEHVSRGEVVGRSGNTGWSTGPHLHFEVMVNGDFVNPMRHL